MLMFIMETGEMRKVWKLGIFLRRQNYWWGQKNW